MNPFRLFHDICPFSYPLIFVVLSHDFRFVISHVFVMSYPMISIQSNPMISFSMISFPMFSAWLFSWFPSCQIPWLSNTIFSILTIFFKEKLKSFIYQWFKNSIPFYETKSSHELNPNSILCIHSKSYPFVSNIISHVLIPMS